VSGGEAPDFLDRAMGDGTRLDPGVSRKVAMLPRANEHSRRTSEPSGVIASSSASIFLVSNVIDIAQSS
jgi:hypothetical protein